MVCVYLKLAAICQRRREQADSQRESIRLCQPVCSGKERPVRHPRPLPRVPEGFGQEGQVSESLFREAVLFCSVLSSRVLSAIHKGNWLKPKLQPGLQPRTKSRKVWLCSDRNPQRRSSSKHLPTCASSRWDLHDTQTDGELPMVLCSVRRLRPITTGIGVFVVLLFCRVKLLQNK